jgi:translation initiation factor 5
MEHIYRDCKACGQRTDVDMRHKLVTFIVKNPPKKAKKAKKGADKEQAEKEGNGKGEGSGEDAGSDDEFTKKLKADAAVLPTAEQVEALGSKLEDWSLDTSPEAVRARQKAALNDGAEDSEGEDADSPYTQLKIWTEENRDTATAVEVYKKVQELGIEKKHKSLQVLGQSLFTASVLEEIPKFGPCLKKLTTSERHQKALLGGIERLVGLDHPDAIPKIPKILMELYQVDILEEEVVKQWGTHVSKKYVDRDISKKVRKAAEPFLKWLEEADDDDEEDEE